MRFGWTLPDSGPVLYVDGRPVARIVLDPLHVDDDGTPWVDVGDVSTVAAVWVGATVAAAIALVIDLVAIAVVRRRRA